MTFTRGNRDGSVPVRRLVRMYGAHVRSELSAAAGHRAQLLLGFFSWTVPFAFLALWRGASSSGAVAGIDRAEFSTYFTVLLITGGLQFVMPLIFRISNLIRTGLLSSLLLRPFHPLHTIITEEIAQKVYQLAPLPLVVTLTILLTGGVRPGGISDVLTALVLCLLGVVSCGYLAAMVGSIAFWMSSSAGIRGLLSGAEWILGGLVAPVALLPGALSTILRHQPFWFADGGPAEIISGISHPDALLLLLEATVWVLGLHQAFRIVWRRGLLRYEAVGT